MKYHAGVGVGWGQWTSDKWRNKGWPLGEEATKTAIISGDLRYMAVSICHHFSEMYLKMRCKNLTAESKAKTISVHDIGAHEYAHTPC